MILDERGNVVSYLGQPDKSDIEKSFLTNRSSQYQEYSWAVHPSSLGRLSYKTLRTLYEVSSAIRPAVDSIAREVSTLPWKIIHKDYKYHDSSEFKEVAEFLRHPNLDDEKLHSIIHKFIHDNLVVGKGVIEKVRNPLGQLKELVARDATLYAPVVNDYGFIVEYIEYKRDMWDVARTHRKRDLIYESFTPVSYSFSTIPIIETIVNEVALLMLSVKSIAWAFTRDEIPPGILALGKIGQEALERAKASFEAAKGFTGQTKLRVLDNVEGDVRWVQFQHPFREMQVAELIPMIERIVFRNFGLSPVESSQIDISRNVAETSFKSSQSKLISPIMTMVSEVMNLEIVEEFNIDFRFIYNRTPQESFIDQSRGLTELVDRGIISTNEARLKMGYDPVSGGDMRSYRLGNEVARIDENTGEPVYRNQPEPSTPTPSSDDQNQE